MTRFDENVCGDLERSLKLEWLETNGLGGFASATIAGVNTRRYHGLLTAATKPPVGRLLLLSKLEEVLIVDGRRFELSANRYPGVVHPTGHQYLKEFRLDPFPIFTYRVGDVEIEKRVFLVHGQNTVVVEYEVTSARACDLEIRPLIAFRDYHGTTHRNDALNSAVGLAEGKATVIPYSGLPALWFAHTGADIDSTGDWYLNFQFDRERERGLDDSEDLFNPFVARFHFNGSGDAAIVASLSPQDASKAGEFRKQEIERRAAIVAAAPSKDPFVEALTAAADQFIVDRGDLKSIIAGYHWFSDWGRDTMIALPGLTLVTGRPEIAKSILLAFVESVDQGMLPNRFPDAGETPEYNTVDATLWFFEAIRSFLHYTNDYGFVREHLYPKLKDIINWHMRGTRYGIQVEGDGLLACGEPGVQLTWMDAKVGDLVVTPRTGKPVEIQALWYNAIRIMEHLAGEFRDEAAGLFLHELASLTAGSFNRLFWNEDAGCLYDVVNGDLRDAAIRPNQIFAVSLRHTMLPPSRAKQVVDVVQRDLLTPLGLRSLAPAAGGYRPHYEGGVYERDSAYHQGTVWPWLMGPFLTAYLKVNGRGNGALAQAMIWLKPMQDHLSSACIGQISEIADADSPHKPCGCVAQAWSVAEILRATVEDVGIRPGINAIHERISPASTRHSQGETICRS